MKIRYSTKFKKDLEKIENLGKKGDPIKSELKLVINILLEGKTLPIKYKDHQLTGNYIYLRECHIKPDWLLIYKVNKQDSELYLYRTGTHSELF